MHMPLSCPQTSSELSEHWLRILEAVGVRTRIWTEISVKMGDFLKSDCVRDLKSLFTFICPSEAVRYSPAVVSCQT